MIGRFLPAWSEGGICADGEAAARNRGETDMASARPVPNGRYNKATDAVVTLLRMLIGATNCFFIQRGA